MDGQYLPKLYSVHGISQECGLDMHVYGLCSCDVCNVPLAKQVIVKPKFKEVQNTLSHSGRGREGNIY